MSGTGAEPARETAPDAAAQAHRAILADTLAFQIGRALLDSRGSARRMILLPLRLWRLARAHARVVGRAAAPAEDGGRGSDPAAEPARAVADLLTGRASAEAAAARLAAASPGPREGAGRMIAAAQALAPSRPRLALALAAAAARLHPPSAAGAARVMAEAGAIAAPLALLGEAAPSGSASGPAPERLSEGAPGPRRGRDRPEAPWIGRLRDDARLAAQGLAIPVRTPAPARRPASDAAPDPATDGEPGDPPPDGRRRRVAYVAHLSEPHHRSGYAVRTREVARALAGAGFETLCATRPGYPWDRRDAATPEAAGAEDRVAGVSYRRFPDPSWGEGPLSAYVAAASARLEAWLAVAGAEVVMAASNHVAAAPALAAARRLGLPFVYEVRGLWEETEASRREGWESSDRYRLVRRLETQICDEADAVAAISTPLAEHLIDRGVSPERLVAAPNGVDPDAFDPAARAPDLRARAGAGPEDALVVFVGSMERYEGLDLLVEALALAPREARLRLALVGGGPAARLALEGAMRAGVADRVALIGRVPPAEAARWLAAADAAAYPRRDAAVCRLVPPLKPLEAMAAGRPTVVSDLPALRELVGSEATARLVAPGDAAALAAALAALAADPEGRARLGAAGRDFAAARRSWRAAVGPLAARLGTLA